MPDFVICASNARSERDLTATEPVGRCSAVRSEARDNGLCLAAVVVCLADLPSECLALTMCEWYPGRWGSLGVSDQCAGLFENRQSAAVRLSQNVSKDLSPVGAHVLKVAERLGGTKVCQW